MVAVRWPVPGVSKNFLTHMSVARVSWPSLSMAPACGCSGPFHATGESDATADSGASDSWHGD